MKRSVAITALKAVLAVAVLGALILVIDVDALLASARAAEVWWMVLALALLPINLMLEAWLWHRLILLEAPSTRFSTAAGALLAGYALGTFTPGRVGDFAGRAFYLSHSDKWAVSAVVFVERLFSMWVAVGVGIVVLLGWLLAGHLEPATAWWSVFVFGCGPALLLTLLFLFPRHSYALLRRRAPAKVHSKLRFLMRLRRPLALRCAGLAGLRYLVYTGQFVMLIRAFTPLGDALAVYGGVALVFFAKFLIPPFTFLDLGIREGAAVFFLGLLGLPQAAAFNASLLLFGTNLVLPALVGVPFVLRLGGLRAARHASAPSSPDAAA